MPFPRRAVDGRHRLVAVQQTVGKRVVPPAIGVRANPQKDFGYRALRAEMGEIEGVLLRAQHRDVDHCGGKAMQKGLSFTQHHERKALKQNAISDSLVYFPRVCRCAEPALAS